MGSGWPRTARWPGRTRSEDPPPPRLGPHAVSGHPTPGRPRGPRPTRAAAPASAARGRRRLRLLPRREERPRLGDRAEPPRSRGGGGQRRRRPRAVSVRPRPPLLPRGARAPRRVLAARVPTGRRPLRRTGARAPAADGAGVPPRTLARPAHRRLREEPPHGDGGGAGPAPGLVPDAPRRRGGDRPTRPDAGRREAALRLARAPLRHPRGDAAHASVRGRIPAAGADAPCGCPGRKAKGAAPYRASSCSSISVVFPASTSTMRTRVSWFSRESSTS